MLGSFHMNRNTIGFHPQTQSYNHLVQQNKEEHSKVLITSYHLNGHTIGFHLVQQNKQYLRKVLLSSFHMNVHTLECRPQTQTLQSLCLWRVKTLPQRATLNDS